mgnify:FL=1
MIQIPDFKDKAQLFAYLRANKQLLVTAKKSAIKYADAIMFSPFVTNSTGKIEKAVANIELLNANEFPVDIVINTTYIRDSHKDVHIDGIWKKSISERKMIYHLQEHEMRFDKVISDTVRASTRKMTWAELGENYEGSTEALVFHSTITKDRNPFMFEQYARGYVKNHSVGMQYVKIDLAMNSESKYDQDEKAVWDKYIDKIANREEVEADGYFWAVTEAKLIEGSAVLIGSNRVTPTINIGEAPKALNTADDVTDPEPLNWGALAEAFKSKSK